MSERLDGSTHMTHAQFAEEIRAAERRGAERVAQAVEAVCGRAETIQPRGSADWQESGVAMRTTILREIRVALADMQGDER